MLGIYQDFRETQPFIRQRLRHHQTNILRSDGSFGDKIHGIEVFVQLLSACWATLCARSTFHHQGLPFLAIGTHFYLTTFEFVTISGFKANAHILHLLSLSESDHVGVAIGLVLLSSKEGVDVAINQCNFALVATITQHFRRYRNVFKSGGLWQFQGEILFSKLKRLRSFRIVVESHVLHKHFIGEGSRLQTCPIHPIFAYLHAPLLEQSLIHLQSSRFESRGKAHRYIVFGLEFLMIHHEISTLCIKMSLCCHSRSASLHHKRCLLSERLRSQSRILQHAQEGEEGLVRAVGLSVRHIHSATQTFQCSGIKTLVCFQRSIGFCGLHEGRPTLCHIILLLSLHKLLCRSHHRLQFQQPGCNLCVEQLLVFVGRSLALRHHLNVLLQVGEQLLEGSTIAALILLHRLRHIFVIIPAEIGRKGLVSLAQRCIFGESILKCLLPRGHVVKSRIVPRIVCHREECDARHHALLHGIGHHTKSIFQRLLHTRIVVHGTHLHEVGVHVGGVNLLIGVVVARIVPPPSHGTTEFFVHRCQIAAIGHRPHTPSRGVDGDVGRHSRQGFEETLAIGLSHPTQGVNLWHKVQRTHAIFGGAACLVPLRINGFLHSRQVIRICFAVCFRSRHTHVVHEDGKLAHT